MDKCYLCNSNERDEVKYGEFMTRGDVSVHYFCLLLTSNLLQRGRDDQGFLGFLVADIKKEAARVAPATCCYCKKKSANISCCAAKCRRTFHLVCGLENDAESEFVDTFKSYCNLHTSGRKVRGPKSNDTCCICYEDILGDCGRFNSVKMLQAPCCKNGWFHKWCLASFAKTSGYFFRCPLCNDSKVFRKRLVYKGIFIPDRDAAWELVPNAFAELLERPKTCSAVVCGAKSGRTSSAPRNKLLICGACGSVAIHRRCMTVECDNFYCDECSSIISAVNNASIVNVSASQHVNSDDEDEEIDICGDDDDSTALKTPQNNDDTDEIVRPLGRLKKHELRIFNGEMSSEAGSDREDDIIFRRNFHKPTAKRNRLLSSDSESPVFPVSSKRKRVSSQDSESFFDSGAESGRSESSGDKFGFNNSSEISTTSVCTHPSGGDKTISSNKNKFSSTSLSKISKSVCNQLSSVKPDKQGPMVKQQDAKNLDGGKKRITRRTSLASSPSSNFCIARRTRSRSICTDMNLQENVYKTRSASKQRLACSQPADIALGVGGYSTPISRSPPVARSRRRFSLGTKIENETGSSSVRPRTSSEDPSKTSPALERTRRRSFLQSPYGTNTQNKLQKVRSSEVLTYKHTHSEPMPVNSWPKKIKTRSTQSKNENDYVNSNVSHKKRSSRDRSPLSSNVCSLYAFITPGYVKKKEQQKGLSDDGKVCLETELISAKVEKPFSKNKSNIIRPTNKETIKTKNNTANKDLNTPSTAIKSPINAAQETFLQSYSLLIGTPGKTNTLKPRKKRCSHSFSKQHLPSNQTKIETFFKRI